MPEADLQRFDELQVHPESLEVPRVTSGSFRSRVRKRKEVVNVDKEEHARQVVEKSRAKLSEALGIGLGTWPTTKLTLWEIWSIVVDGQKSTLGAQSLRRVLHKWQEGEFRLYEQVLPASLRDMSSEYLSDPLVVSDGLRVRMGKLQHQHQHEGREEEGVLEGGKHAPSCMCHQEAHAAYVSQRGAERRSTEVPWDIQIELLEICEQPTCIAPHLLVYSARKLNSLGRENESEKDDGSYVFTESDVGFDVLRTLQSAWS